MLYLVATPIGNLADITFRAIEILKSCDYILCEDTRHSRTLLSHYGIEKSLKSFHKFSETSQEAGLISDLKQGLHLALITDAGTPGISDPGTRLVQACVEEKIPVVAIPGACAAITALSCSGMTTERFQFVGFLPRKEGALRTSLLDILSYPGTTVTYESPNRIENVLKCLDSLATDRKLTIARELTKKFEELIRGTASEILHQWHDRSIKGEIVLLISGQETIPSQQWDLLTPEEHVDFLQKSYGISNQEAIKMAAKMRGVSKRDIYNILHNK